MARAQHIGLTIGTVFGLVYVLVNAGDLPSPWPLVLRAAGVLSFIGVQLALAAAASRPAPEREGGVAFTRGYWLVVAVEVVALIAGTRVLARVFDLPEAGVTWVTVVVGVHFFVLAVLWRDASLHVLGAALVLCGVVGLVLAFADAGHAAVATAGGVVPGFVLLAGSALAARTTGRVPVSA